MGCGCKKKKTTSKPKPTIKKNLTQEQQEQLVNEVINKINNLK